MKKNNFTPAKSNRNSFVIDWRMHLNLVLNKKFTEQILYFRCGFLNGSSDLPSWVQRGGERCPCSHRGGQSLGKQEHQEKANSHRGPTAIPEPSALARRALKLRTSVSWLAQGGNLGCPSKVRKTRQYFLEPQCILIKEEYDFLLIFFLIFSFLLNSGGHCNPQLLYFQSCPCCRLRTGVIYC